MQTSPKPSAKVTSPVIGQLDTVQSLTSVPTGTWHGFWGLPAQTQHRIQSRRNVGHTRMQDILRTRTLRKSFKVKRDKKPAGLSQAGGD